jgi:uncharacterized protein YbbC (DUF1343 family)
MPSLENFSRRRALRAAIVCFSLLAVVSSLPSAVAQQRLARARSSARAPRSRPSRVQTGLDVLEAEKFAPLKGKRVGLITNHTGVDAQGRTTIDLLAKAPGVKLVALFSPEHGLLGRADENIASAKDPLTGLPVYSLYGETRRPTDEMLAGIDALVFDIQDAGVRFYTYTSTMGYCMEAAAKHNVAFYVLDRPNPLGGQVLEGPMLDPDKTGWLAYDPLPIRYGLTIGELAQYFNTENHINCDLHVIQMRNWHRNYFYESTGVRWIPPSPNLRTIKGSIVYPGLEILQNAGVSVGRGTETPFEQFGAPWMNSGTVADALNARKLPGLHFAAESFIPVSGLYAGQRCGAVAIRITDRVAVRSMRLGIEIAAILQRLYPAQFDPAKLIGLVGNDETIRELQQNVPPEQIVASWAPALSSFDVTRRKYFLYK